MKRFLALLAVGAACLAYSINAVSQTLPVLYDSSIKAPVPNASSSDIARVYKELLRVGGTQLKNKCYDGKLPAVPKLAGLARGAFTRKGIAQVAWLFQLCFISGYSDKSFYGLVIVENQQTVRVSSLLYLDPEITGETEFYSLRDINLNGTDELALISTSAEMAIESRILTLFEQTSTSLSALGYFQVYQRFADPDMERFAGWDRKVFVIKGRPPVFIAIPKSGERSALEIVLGTPQLELQTFLAR